MPASGRGPPDPTVVAAATVAVKKTSLESGDDSEEESEILEESPCGRWLKRREVVSALFPTAFLLFVYFAYRSRPLIVRTGTYISNDLSPLLCFFAGVCSSSSSSNCCIIAVRSLANDGSL